MGKIYYVMGKSSSGKDTIYKSLLREESLSLCPIVLYTTRPIREGERDGVEYFFISDSQLEEMRKEGRLIESRTYKTVHGDWTYATSADGIALDKNSYLAIGTPEAYLQIRDYYGEESVLPIYIQVDDGVRLQRALDREKKQAIPRYEEMCRRFLADSDDFSEDVLQRIGLKKRFQNVELEACIEQIKDYIVNGN